MSSNPLAFAQASLELKQDRAFRECKGYTGHIYNAPQTTDLRDGQNHGVFTAPFNESTSLRALGH